MPDPRSPEWGRAAAEEVIKIVNATEGRAFVLSTSIAGMNDLFERVASQIDYPCFVPGQRVQGRAAEEVSHDPECRAVCDVEFLAGR